MTSSATGSTFTSGVARKTDLTGKRFGRLIALRDSGKRVGRGKVVWTCQCDCGAIKDVLGEPLRKGQTRSCGCLHSETARAQQHAVCFKHGKAKQKVWQVWVGMRQRCQDSNSPSFARYGGRGIRVCPEWQDFEAFYRDMGDPPPGLTLDRKDNDGPYCKDNCRWATRQEQASNRSSNVVIAHHGRSLTVKQWAEEVGLPYKTLHSRLKGGWDVELALRTPLLKSGPRTREDYLRPRPD